MLGELEVGRKLWLPIAIDCALHIAAGRVLMDERAPGAVGDWPTEIARSVPTRARHPALTRW
jgi:hypothetical protein